MHSREFENDNFRSNNDDEFHLTITLPQRITYSVEEIIREIAFMKHPCTADCNACQQLGLFDQIEIPIPMHRDDRIELSECTISIRDRLAYMKYLAIRLHKLVTTGKLDLWSASRETISDFPQLKNHVEFFIGQWLERAHIYRSDLERFCKIERIRLSFDNSANQQEATAHTPATSSIIGETTLPLSPKRKRKDALAIEINLILSQSPTLTPSDVKAKLRERAGTPNCSIVEATSGGIKWERDSGETVETLNESIDKRIDRWKAKNSPPRLPPS